MDPLAFWLLVALFVKHWYIDFVNQSMDEVHGKGIYGNWLGIRHSLKHGVITLVIFGAFGWNFWPAVVLGVMDFVVHYHTDWAKMNWGNRDIQNPKFWAHLGLDQLVHSLFYVTLLFWLTV